MKLWNLQSGSPRRGVGLGSNLSKCAKSGDGFAPHCGSFTQTPVIVAKTFESKLMMRPETSSWPGFCRGDRENPAPGTCTGHHMSSLLDDYRRHAADHGAYMIEGEADSSNESYDRLQEVFIALVRKGRRDELFRLYDDVDSSVQCWAAAHTLEVDETRALAKLAHLEKSGVPHVGMDAEYTIKEWKNGVLRFLPR